MSKVNQLSGYETIPPLANGYPLKIRKYIGADKLVPHWHEHLEIVYILKGSCSFFVGGKRLEASPGDIIAVNGSEVHSYTSEERPEYYCLLIYPSFFKDVDFSGIMIKNLIRNDDTCRECLEGIFKHERGGVAGELMQKSLAYRLLSHLITVYPRERLTERDRAQRGAALDRLDMVFEFIAENHASHISTKHLAEVCFLSEGHFCRFFKSATGKSALEYISEYRTDRACALLLNTSLPLGDIAHNVGFEDTNYFCRVFRRIKGISPMSYRRTARSNELQRK